MKLMGYLFLRKNRVAAVVLAVLVLSRVAQALALQADPYASTEFFDGYLSFNGAHAGAFVLIPCAAVILQRASTFCARPQFAIAAGSRPVASVRCWLLMVAFGLATSAMVTGSAVVALMLSTGMVPSDTACLLASALMQAVVFTVGATIAVILLLVAGIQAIALMGMIAYGMWDFMAMNIVGGGVPCVGWGIAFLVPGFEMADLVFRLGFFGALLFGSLAVLALAFSRVDYVARGNPDK